MLKDTFEENKELQLASDFVQYTAKNIFLTGKAGTGKTTFLRKLKDNIFKRMVVVAPTGVAAINAGGVTIHSFFQLPFGPQIPEEIRIREGIKQEQKFKMNRNKILVIKSLDLLVIDEISMVRADLLDAIDEVLRRYKDRGKPFGGVQLLMIGDLYQLPPIVKDEEWQMLKEYYDTSFFFGSKALLKTAPVRIELKHIYRQSDKKFIDILGEIRENKISAQTLYELNKRYLPDFKHNDKDGYIILTTHNAIAHNTNAKRLEKLKTKSYTFYAEIKGDFPAFIYPTEDELVVKEGAQVMFVKNDSAWDKRYYNGKIGRVVNIEDGVVYVRCSEDDSLIAVEPDTWNNVRYELDEKSNELKEKIIGSFTQYPLRLAWAITIHKSQGLTFDKAIIDANAAFAFGQVYVALSRCRSLEGLVLHSPIGDSAIKSNHTVYAYTTDMGKNVPDEIKLKQEKIEYQKQLIVELFDFSALSRSFYYVEKIIRNAGASLLAEVYDSFKKNHDDTQINIIDVGIKFNRQLNTLLNSNDLPEKNDVIQDRFKKAAAYFFEKTGFVLEEKIQHFSYVTDNKSVAGELQHAITRLQKELFFKKQCFKASINGFDVLSLLKAKSDADVDFEKQHSLLQRKPKSLSESIPHPALYKALMSWREDLALSTGMPLNKVLPAKSLARLLVVLPATTEELERVKGVGKAITTNFGDEIVEIISAYCSDKSIKRSADDVIEAHVKKTPPKGASQRETLNMFKQGFDITEIAKQRNLAENTIEGHLSHFITTGDLDIFDLLPKEKVDSITDCLKENAISSVTQAKQYLGNTASFGEIRAVINHLNRNNS